MLNFWKFTSYCSLKPLWSGMGEVVPARTSPTLHPLIPSYCASIVVTSTLRVKLGLPVTISGSVRRTRILLVCSCMLLTSALLRSAHWLNVHCWAQAILPIEQSIPRSTYIHPPSLAKIGQRTSEEIGNKQTDRQTDKQTNAARFIVWCCQIIRSKKANATSCDVRDYSW